MNELNKNKQVNCSYEETIKEILETKNIPFDPPQVKNKKDKITNIPARTSANCNRVLQRREKTTQMLN